MSSWNDEELETVDRVDELSISSVRDDGSLSSPVVIWAVRVGDQVYVRSVRGRASGWFTATRATGTGRISIGDIEKDVAFAPVPAGAEEQEAISEAYRTKYRRYAKDIVDSTLTPDALAATLAVVPR